MDLFEINDKVMTINEGVATLDVDFIAYCECEPWCYCDKPLITENPFETVEVVEFPSSLIRLNSQFSGEIFKKLQIVDCSKSKQLRIIGVECFETLLKKAKIVLPDSVEIIGDHAFSRSNLENFDWTFKSLTLGEYCFEKIGIHSIKLRSTDGPMVIGKGAFRESQVLEVELESAKGLTLGENCFGNCCYLKIVTFNCKCEVLPRRAFGWCNRLKRVQLPKGLKVIEEKAFEFCEQLKMLMLPDSVERIDKSAFSGCKDSLVIRFVGREWKLPDFLELISKNDRTLRECALADIEHSRVSVDNFTVRGDCLRINDDVEVFIDAVDANTEIPVKTITKLIIPKTLRVLDAAFNCFTSLEIVEVPKDSNLMTIGDECFQNIETLREFNFPKSIKIIGDNAFTNTGLKKLVIETENLALKLQCFSECRKLESIVIKSLKSTSLFVFNHGCFDGCTTLREAIFDCDSLDLPCFFLEKAKQLRVLELPRSVTMINFKALAGCNSLRVLKLPDSVMRIQDKNMFSTLSEDIMIEYLGLIWSRDTFSQVVVGHEEELERYGIRIIDDDSKYYEVFFCGGIDRVPLLEEYLSRLPITLGEFIQSVYPEEFAILNSKRCETPDTIEETTLF